MGAPETGMQAAEFSTAETLLTAFRTIKPAERQKHVAVLDYWLSIRGDKEFSRHCTSSIRWLSPTPRPCSILLELISSGQDAEIRRLGDALRAMTTRSSGVIDTSDPSLLSSMAQQAADRRRCARFPHLRGQFHQNSRRPDPLLGDAAAASPAAACVGRLCLCLRQPRKRTEPRAPEPVEAADVVEAELEEPAEEAHCVEEVEAVAEAAAEEPVAEQVEAVAEAPARDF